MSEKPCARLAPRNLSAIEFAQRLGCHPDTIRRNAYLRRHAVAGMRGLEWPAAFVDAHCASQAAPVDLNEHQHSKADVARLTGWSLAHIDRRTDIGKLVTGLRCGSQRHYSDADVRRLILERGSIGIEGVCYFLEAKNQNPVALMIGRGQLHKPDTVAPDGSWLWLDPAKVLEHCGKMLDWLNASDGGSARLDILECWQWSDVPGLPELEQWALEEADRVDAVKLKTSRSADAVAKRAAMEADAAAERMRQYRADLPRQRAEAAAYRAKLEADKVTAARNRAAHAAALQAELEAIRNKPVLLAA